MEGIVNMGISLVKGEGKNEDGVWWITVGMNKMEVLYPRYFGSRMKICTYILRLHGHGTG